MGADLAARGIQLAQLSGTHQRLGAVADALIPDVRLADVASHDIDCRTRMKLGEDGVGQPEHTGVGIVEGDGEASACIFCLADHLNQRARLISPPYER